MKKDQSAENLSREQTYEVKGMLFVVQPIFKKESNKTLGVALIRLMESDIDSKLYS